MKLTKFKTPIYGDLFQRVVVHSLVLTFLVLLLYSSLFPITSLALGFTLALCGSIGTYEYGTMAKVKLGYTHRTYSACGSFIFLLMSFFAIRWHPTFPNLSLLSWVFLFSWLVIHTFQSRKRSPGPIETTGITLFAIMYVSIPLRLFLNILYGFIHTEEPFLGVWWASFLIAVTKGADIFGYFFGKALGQKKISPEISPNKTIVGFVAGCLGATLISILFFLQVPSRFNHYITMPGILIFLGIILGISSFFGDIIESIFKREARMKDSNRLQAVGGVLDTLDSLLLSTPILYVLLAITQKTMFIG
ncbi:phosphatidate cytidylyltransferase [Chlamydia gallinacea]|uniref:phosphatidate cytidylyltransferase n=1 Tax=Chlamydia gallinacea TaxID=1457153 RepID=UPI0024E1E851|nr:phosphatidate cytidylyltransferase [Chlamydia gallinacea]